MADVVESRFTSRGLNDYRPFLSPSTKLVSISEFIMLFNIRVIHDLYIAGYSKSLFLLYYSIVSEGKENYSGVDDDIDLSIVSFG